MTAIVHSFNASSDNDAQALEGRVKRLVFDAPDGRMRVFQIELDDKSVETVRQYDNINPIKTGDQIKVLGKITHHKQYGKQFTARDVLKRMPTGPEGIAKVISGKSFKGIGPKLARKIADTFGSDLISILNRGDPGELLADLIGPKKAKVLIDVWGEDQRSNAANAVLADLGVGPEIRKKIIETIPEFETVLQTDPYRIAKEVNGIGFLTADALAQRAGTFKPDSPQRLAMGLQHALDLGQQNGHTGLSYPQLLDEACKALTFGDRKAVANILEQEMELGALVKSPNQLYQKPIVARTEMRLARSLVRLSKRAPRKFNANAIQQRLGKLKTIYKLTDEQLAAVAAAIKHGMSILTGGPGTGKTYTIKAIIETIIELIKECGDTPRILLIAPTGKAADRMQESTGYEASTIHMALGVNKMEGGFLHNEKNPFSYDLIIADEFSMVDSRLADSFTRAIGEGRLVIVGDIDQLPSVDAGRVLHDIIESGLCPVTRLTQVRRTGEGSAIALGAARINQGKMPDFGKPGDSDLVFIELDEPQAAAERIVQMVSEKLPKNLGYGPSQIQVLSPGKSSMVGVHALNAALQKALNPNPPIAVGGNPNDRVVIKNGHQARIGDRIICMKTNYDMNVFNGDMGTIEDCDCDDANGATLLNQFGKKNVILDRNYWNNLDLAYAMTIHKSQGSEYDVVIIPMTTSHYVMLKRNLFYTGVTRAKKLCIVVGSKKAVTRCLNTIDGTSRQTGLLARIRAMTES